jgi:hypothetical protein
MNRVQLISKRLLSSNLSKRIIAATVRLGIFIFLFATSNAASALETIAKLLGKALQDNTSASDAPSKAITKPATDAPAASDNNAKTVDKSITDELFSTDDLNGAGADDDQNISFFKVLSHPSFIVDNIVLLAAFLRSFSDTAQTSDLQTLSFDKNIDDTPAASDAQVKLSTMGKSDTIATGSAGTLLNQDYVDNGFYFADDYVGVKRTF